MVEGTTITAGATEVETDACLVEGTYLDTRWVCHLRDVRISTLGEHGVDAPVQGYVLVERDLKTTTTEEEEATLRSCSCYCGDELLGDFEVARTEVDVRRKSKRHVQTC